MGDFELGKKYGVNSFEVRLPDHWKLAKTFNVSTMKPSIVDYTRE
jgi:hypothetical protein